jgi:hypothetical protein
MIHFPFWKTILFVTPSKGYEIPDVSLVTEIAKDSPVDNGITHVPSNEIKLIGVIGGGDGGSVGGVGDGGGGLIHVMYDTESRYQVTALLE